MELGPIFAPVAREMAEVDTGLQALMRRVGAQAAAGRGKTHILDRIACRFQVIMIWKQEAVVPVRPNRMGNQSIPRRVSGFSCRDVIALGR